MPGKHAQAVAKNADRDMQEYKRGRPKSGRHVRAGGATSRKEAIAIALSEARKEGKKVPLLHKR